jgi:hypothetical protein
MDFLCGMSRVAGFSRRAHAPGDDLRRSSRVSQSVTLWSSNVKCSTFHISLEVYPLPVELERERLSSRDSPTKVIVTLTLKSSFSNVYSMM